MWILIRPSSKSQYGVRHLCASNLNYASYENVSCNTCAIRLSQSNKKKSNLLYFFILHVFLAYLQRCHINAEVFARNISNMRAQMWMQVIVMKLCCETWSQIQLINSESSKNETQIIKCWKIYVLSNDQSFI